MELRSHCQNQNRTSLSFWQQCAVVQPYIWNVRASRAPIPVNKVHFIVYMFVSLAVKSREPELRISRDHRADSLPIAIDVPSMEIASYSTINEEKRETRSQLEHIGSRITSLFNLSANRSESYSEMELIATIRTCIPVLLRRECLVGAIHELPLRSLQASY